MRGIMKFCWRLEDDESLTETTVHGGVIAARLHYEILQVCQHQEPYAIPEGRIAARAISLWNALSGGLLAGGRIVSSTSVAAIASIARVAGTDVDALLSGGRQTFRIISCTKDRLRYGDLFGNQPPRSVVKRLWQERTARIDNSDVHDASRSSHPNQQDILLRPRAKRKPKRVGHDDPPNSDIPEATKRRSDPCKMLDAIDFSSKLRDTRLFSDALDAALGYLFDSDDEAEGVLGSRRNRADDPSEKTIRRANLGLDSVSMLIERRKWARMAANPQSVHSVHVYSDASGITGEELQGNVYDICRDSGVQRRIMPGTSLAYGCLTTLDKIVAFLWSSWLISGSTPCRVDIFPEQGSEFYDGHGAGA